MHESPRVDPPPSSWLVDAHVHVHPGTDPGTLLDAASRNFERAARALGLGGGAAGVLMLTESQGVDFFGAARRAVSGGPLGVWTVRATGEDGSVVLRREGRPPLALIAGRQIVTRAGLEVLALGTSRTIEDGLPLDRALDAARQAGALPTIPWGFGKWWLGRGRLVRDLVERAVPGSLFLGDNGGRPAWSIRPPLFDAAESRGIRVLPGTDPLPLAGQAGRAGSYGFVVEAPFDDHRPAAAVTGAIREARGPLRAYGRGERLMAFVRCQASMQLRRFDRGAAR